MNARSESIAVAGRADIPSRRAPVTRERIGRMLLGISALAATGLGYFHDPAWLLVLVGISLNMLQSSITDRCVINTILAKLGFPSERDIGRLEGRTGRTERRGGVTR